MFTVVNDSNSLGLHTCKPICICFVHVHVRGHKVTISYLPRDQLVERIRLRAFKALLILGNLIE